MIEMLNAWAAIWTDWMATALIEGTALFIVASVVWPDFSGPTLAQEIRQEIEGAILERDS